MRRPHYLKRNSKVELPQYMIFVDTETKGVKQDEQTEHHFLWFGWAAAIRIRPGHTKDKIPEHWFRFTRSADFWAWVSDRTFPKTRTWIMAHNWNFDAGVLNVSHELPKLGFETTLYINDKPPFIVDFRRDKSTIRLCDTLNYFAGSLASIGESIGFSKLSMPDMQQSQESWDTYCKQDVRVLMAAFLGFRSLVEELELGNFQPTLASQSFTAFRHKYMDKQILIHAEEAICKEERNAYYGGRTECFYIGRINERIYSLDINSMYPALMAYKRYPVKLSGKLFRPSISDIANNLSEHAVIARVTISTDEPIYPIRYGGRLCFPVGRFTTTLSTPELEYAIEHQHLQGVEAAIIYEQDYLFKAFVEDLYALRQKYRADGNETYTYMVKILMNSLYGKFGQNGSKWYDTGTADEPFEGVRFEQDSETGKIRKLRVRLGMLQEFRREGESQNSFPAISGHVTAYGRMQLYTLIQKAGVENVYYTDTDSLMVNEVGKNNLHSELNELRLGWLKVEKQSDDVIIFAPKDYIFGSNTKHKGVKLNARRVGMSRFEQEQFASWDYQINRGYDGYIPIRTITKTLNRDYKKGTLTETGWVKPLELMEVN